MGKINVLDKHIAELIAAGEVVERPSSVIKELVENTIDAGATSVTVEIKHGGIAYMRVTDNGAGILREDVPKAFLRHATSKVKNERDLDAIVTLGFRGEALASISAVSKVELLTCNKEETIGTKYKIYGGEELLLEEAGCPTGTTIIVRELFYNIPARMKFLKRDVSEANAVAGVMDKIALSHPEVAFTLIRDGKQTLKTPGDGKLKSAIYAVYGKEFASGLLPVEYEFNGVLVSGFVSKPQNSRANRSMQNFFINGRFVKSRTAMAALEQACKGSVMVGKFPSCVLQIELSCEAVDVNVHPAKIEVRFLNERPIFDAVYHGVKTALLKKDKIKEIKLSTEDILSHKQPNPFSMEKNAFTAKKDAPEQIKLNIQPVLPQANITEEAGDENLSAKENDSIEPELFIPKKSLYQTNLTVADTSTFFYSNNKELPKTVYVNGSDNIQNNQSEKNAEAIEKEMAEHSQSTSLQQQQNRKGGVNDNEEYVKEKEGFSDEQPLKNHKDISNAADQISHEEINVKYLGEAFFTYILVQYNESELLLIDKHALHERMIYEKLKKEKGEGNMQYLLTPLSVTLSKGEYNCLLENKDILLGACFEIDDFGNGTILVRGIPQYIDSQDIKSTIEEIAGHLLEKSTDVHTEQMDWIFHNVACRAAIKGGDINHEPELMELVHNMLKDKTLRYCPHGRPVSITLTKKEIEKQFGRV